VTNAVELLGLLNQFTPQPTEYFRQGANRIAASINMIPEGQGVVLELGCDSHFTLAMSELTDYTIVPQNSRNPFTGCENVESPTVTFSRKDSTQVSFRRELFDLECDPYPYPDNSIDGVVCCEVLEHLVSDPVWMLHEVNRILKPGAWFLLTTPNLTSYHSIRRAATGSHPLQHSMYFGGEKTHGLPIQHTREYAFWEVIELLKTTGFGITKKETHTFTQYEKLGWRDYLLLLPAIMAYNTLKLYHPKHLLLRYRLPNTLVLAKKERVPQSRYPSNLYVQS
jgi:SAM-dependent methyltransferase